QEVATELLRDVGFVVELAGNGQIALDKIRTAQYDIVLMDMQMPVMDGVTATREIRKEARFANLPVVAMTANAMQGDRERCIAAGMNDHVAKPIEPEELWQALLKWVRPKQLPTALAAILPQAGELPAMIEGLDIADGLRRVLGKKQLYLWMLRKFISGQRSATAEIRRALDNDDSGSAELLIHTLKGVAGNIGATAIQHLAETIETAVRERLPRRQLDDRLSKLDEPLAKLIAQMEQQLPEEPHNTPPTVDPALLRIVCARLEALLIADDSLACELLDRNSETLKAAFPQHYPGLSGHIRSLDFDKALVALRSATAAPVAADAGDDAALLEMDKT
ncbi:MAG: response regulator, partial [Gallionellaceae bacterium]|nr:response regulator [Gallionellaceae bacterium]